MDKIKISFPDQSIHEFEKNVTLFDVASSISQGFARNVLGAVIDEEHTHGLSYVLTKDCKVRFVKFEDKEGKKLFWHTSSHIMALAIQRLFPKAKFAIGPAIAVSYTHLTLPTTERV